MDIIINCIVQRNGSLWPRLYIHIKTRSDFERGAFWGKMDLALYPFITLRAVQACVMYNHN